MAWNAPKKLFSVDPPRGGYGRKRDERGVEREERDGEWVVQF